MSLSIDEIRGNSSMKIGAVEPINQSAPIGAEMNRLMDRVHEVAGARIASASAQPSKSLADLTSMSFKTPQSALTEEVAGTKLSATPNGNIAHKMMDHYIKMVEIICKLKAAKIDGINDLIKKVDESMEKQCYWINAQGDTDILGLTSGGALKIGAIFMGDSSFAKIMDGVSQFLPQFSQTTKTFMQSYSIPHELAKNMIVNIKLPQANDKMRSYGESLKEANQHLEQLMQLMKQAKSKINQG